MARKIASGLELSWSTPLKQWYRTVPVSIDEKGKVKKKQKYFGTGKGKSDQQAYRQARHKYRLYMQDWNVQQAATTFFKQTLKGDAPMTQLQQWLLANRPHLMDPNLSDEEALRKEEARMQLRGVMEKSAKKSRSEHKVTINKHVENWLKVEEQRQLSGQIKRMAYQTKSMGINTFKQWNKQTHFGDERDVEALLMNYRDFLVERVHLKQYTPSTVNDKLKFCGQFKG